MGQQITVGEFLEKAGQEVQVVRVTRNKILQDDGVRHLVEVAYLDIEASVLQGKAVYILDTLRDEWKPLKPLKPLKGAKEKLRKKSADG